MSEDNTQFEVMVKHKVKELIADTAEQDGVSFNDMCQILFIEALMARGRKEEEINNQGE